MDLADAISGLGFVATVAGALNFIAGKVIMVGTDLASAAQAAAWGFTAPPPELEGLEGLLADYFAGDLDIWVEP